MIVLYNGRIADAEQPLYQCHGETCAVLAMGTVYHHRMEKTCSNDAKCEIDALEERRNKL